jgi:hypothetical protein
MNGYHRPTKNDERLNILDAMTNPASRIGEPPAKFDFKPCAPTRAAMPICATHPGAAHLAAKM